VVQRYLSRSSHRSLTSSSRALHYLFLLNLGLQVWDGLATYFGVQLGFPEGNALLRTWMGNWGAGLALVSAKTAACGLLFLLRCLEDLFLLRCAMTLTAGLYLSFSFVPWLLVLLFR
jgi:hypothetical protein